MRIKCQIDLKEYFGPFVQDSQIVDVEGDIILARDNFFGQDVLILSVEGESEPMILNKDKCRNIEII